MTKESRALFDGVGSFLWLGEETTSASMRKAADRCHIRQQGAEMHGDESVGNGDHKVGG
ncbi:hypothetical protein CGMCC3_g16380 [Colletotrichum fructicola]|nr:uncharacterized protein CGMCC3_g16380 [Colletotrichum fructicola]KAE9567540.1 hypothetical protein CGMCC3_g16380 [Colletotrichum fructicola]